MKHHAILIASGADRPGILDEVSQFVFERGANISDSKLLSMRGTFIMMVLLDADDPATVERIGTELPGMSATANLALELRAAGPATGDGSSFRYRFTATGADKAGILNKLSHLFRVLNVNIDDVHTHVGVIQSMVRPQFELELLLSVPRDTPVTRLREYLDTLCTEMSIHWELRPA
ncbi:MAG TPA: ACT domain-containing protein [Tepidisphaeraceae bacterium]|nr:ACT domain-containing protein [Tepidisphaeraceae bacterium]